MGAAKNGLGVVGVAPEASLVAVRIADDEVSIHRTSWLTGSGASHAVGSAAGSSDPQSCAMCLVLSR